MRNKEQRLSRPKARSIVGWVEERNPTLAKIKPNLKFLACFFNPGIGFRYRSTQPTKNYY